MVKTGEVHACPAGGGAGALEVVVVVVVVVRLVVELDEVDVVGFVVGDSVGFVVGDSVGVTVGEVDAEAVGVEPSQVTVTTVGLVAAYVSGVPAQVAVVVPPAATARAPAGTAAAGRGTTARLPATTARPRRVSALGAASAAAAATTWVSRVSPFTTVPALLWPWARDVYARRTPTAVTCRAPSTSELAATGAVSRAPSKVVVIMETRAAGVTVADAAPVPAAPARYQADSRSPLGPLTLSYALVQPSRATVDPEGVSTVVTRTLPAPAPVGTAVDAVALDRAAKVVLRPA